MCSSERAGSSRLWSAAGRVGAGNTAARSCRRCAPLRCASAAYNKCVSAWELSCPPHPPPPMPSPHSACRCCREASLPYINKKTCQTNAKNKYYINIPVTAQMMCAGEQETRLLLC